MKYLLEEFKVNVKKIYVTASTKSLKSKIALN